MQLSALQWESGCEGTSVVHALLCAGATCASRWRMRRSWRCRRAARTCSSRTGCSCTCLTLRWRSWRPTRCAGCAAPCSAAAALCCAATHQTGHAHASAAPCYGGPLHQAGEQKLDLMACIEAIFIGGSSRGCVAHFPTHACTDACRLSWTGDSDTASAGGGGGRAILPRVLLPPVRRPRAQEQPHALPVCMRAPACACVRMHALHGLL